MRLRAQLGHLGKSTESSFHSYSHSFRLTPAFPIMTNHSSNLHLAAEAGFGVVVIDASDLCLGVDELEDHERCCSEVAHIRAALRLATQSSKRRMRVMNTDTEPNVFNFAASGEDNDNSVDSGAESDPSNHDEEEVGERGASSVEDSSIPIYDKDDR